MPLYRAQFYGELTSSTSNCPAYLNTQRFAELVIGLPELTEIRRARDRLLGLRAAEDVHARLLHGGEERRVISAPTRGE